MDNNENKAPEVSSGMNNLVLGKILPTIMSTLHHDCKGLKDS